MFPFHEYRFTTFISEANYSIIYMHRNLFNHSLPDVHPPFFPITDSTTVNSLVHISLHSPVNISVEHIARSIMYTVKFFILSHFSLLKVHQPVLLPTVSDSTLLPLSLGNSRCQEKSRIFLLIPLPSLPLCPPSSTTSSFQSSPQSPSHPCLTFPLLHLSLTCVS